MMQKPPLKMAPSVRVPHIRWMIRRDMQAVLAIERASFAWPWDEEDFARALRQINCIGMVAEYGEKVVSFMIYELDEDCITILNFAVAPEHRRSQVGLHIFAWMKTKMPSHRRTRIETTVRETNMPALLFFRACGFLAVDMYRGHFDDTGEDGIVMRYDLEDVP